MSRAPTILDIRQLSVTYPGAEDSVRNLSLSIAEGEAYGLIGESGSGKSTIASAILRDVHGAASVRGEIRLDGHNVIELPERAMQQLRGKDVAFVAQNALSALNPSMRIGQQVAETLRRHTSLRGKALRKRVLQLLEQVGLPDTPRLARRYPHQLSGGQQQRTLIAMAIACAPRLLILDEPTTGLDPTTAVRIVALIERLRRETRMAILFISHDLGIVARLCERIGVLRAGQLVEEGATAQVLRHPTHAYTQCLLRAVPRLSDNPAQRPGSAPATAPLLTIGNLGKTYSRWRWPWHIERFHALSHLSLSVAQGEVVAIVGESGSGKSTLARCIVGLLSPSTGSIAVEHTPLAPTAAGRPGELQRRLQMVFQNPGGALNPHHTVERLVSRPLVQAGSLDATAIAERVRGLLEQVRLSDRHLDRLPHQLSGGEKQRVSLARALASDPDVLVCDESTSALDVSVQASVLDTLLELRDRRNMGIVFICHDLALVRRVADTVVVMRHGQVVEHASGDQLFAAPSHPYTQALLEAAQAKDVATQ